MLERDKYALLRNDLQKSRLNAGLTQVEVAKLLKKPQSYISKIESGERSLDLIEFLDYCNAINVNPIKFLTQFINKI